MINFKEYNETYIKIECPDDIAKELHDKFSFEVPGAKFMPSVRNRLWTGKLYLFHLKNRLIYKGLKKAVQRHLISQGYPYSDQTESPSVAFSKREALNFISGCNLPFQPHDYQVETFIRAIRNKRNLFLLNTGAGKGCVIYLIAKYLKLKTLIIVPRTSLVIQLTKDFIDYGESEDAIHQIYGGKDKNTDKLISITTYQSIYKEKPDYFNQYECIINDECHLALSKSITGILEKSTKVQYRFGFTGSLNESKTHHMVLEGLFGEIKQMTTNRELMDRGINADLTIKSIVLQYPDNIRKENKNLSYKEEIDYIIQCKARNNFIANLAHSLDGNVLILFRYVEKHGEHLLELLKAKNKDRSGIYYVYGKTDLEFKDAVRNIVDSQERAILLASVGTTSTGINIKNINHIIFAHPSKGKIQLLQSLGRGLRISPVKNKVTAYDISDDMIWKSRINYTMQHYNDRLKIYKEEQFKLKTYKVEIKI